MISFARYATYLIFFLSGAAALIYEVIWVRSLSLVFGGTHLAVTAVLSVFMGGLALGSYRIGRLVDTVKRPLRLYGYLEIGIALSALAFIVLMRVYPSIYGFLAQGRDDRMLYLTLVRILFAFIALIIPTTLMGGTLPVLTRFVSRDAANTGSQLSLLYGFNTLGAVAGALAAGFYLLRFYSVSSALTVAIAINFVCGMVSMLLQRRVEGLLVRPTAGPSDTGAGLDHPTDSSIPGVRETADPFFARVVLVGIGISGFCALGYEILWTRILTMVIGTSVYGFTIMLVAFLSGITLGSQAFGVAGKLFRRTANGAHRSLVGFGLVQIIIGATALAVTIYIRDLPVHAISLHNWYSTIGLSAFAARILAKATIAFSAMIVPAFFMGLAFPLAGDVTMWYQKKIGRAVGSVLTYNTVGAILGSVISGFLLMYLYGIERSLLMLIVINFGSGLFITAGLMKKRFFLWAAGGVLPVLLILLAINQDVVRIWNMKYLAIFRNNQPDAFDTPEKRQDALENTDVLFYHEGINSTISVIQPKGAHRAVLVNGKVVASSSPMDQQCQLTLGHLPMLLHKNPKRVLVVGLGTGMTLGAASVHPEVEELTLAEIEPEVLGAARTFGKYNNFVLDNPELKIIFNDGRNYLTTTKNYFDVITADPIHPWTQGSGYLYTEEYFRTASEHLAPGGIMCQWLPIYELSVDDLKSVVRTFSQHFRYAMAWLTHYDAEIIGSNSPILFDERELGRRISNPAILENLRQVKMGSATDFLSYFLMGPTQMLAFSEGGVVNTDNNLYLEFSAPRSTGINVMGTNVRVLSRYRESIVPYLVPAPDRIARAKQIRHWKDLGKAAAVYDRAHSLYLGGQTDTPEFRAVVAELTGTYPRYAPGEMLEQLMSEQAANVPMLLRALPFAVMTAQGEQTVTVVSAVLARVSKERAALMFVDNAVKKIYGQVYFAGADIDARMMQFLDGVEQDLQAAYRDETVKSNKRGEKLPATGPMTERIWKVISDHVEIEKRTGQREAM